MAQIVVQCFDKRCGLCDVCRPKMQEVKKIMVETFGDDELLKKWIDHRLFSQIVLSLVFRAPGKKANTEGKGGLPNWGADESLRNRPEVQTNCPIQFFGPPREKGVVNPPSLQIFIIDSVIIPDGDINRLNAECTADKNLGGLPWNVIIRSNGDILEGHYCDGKHFLFNVPDAGSAVSYNQGNISIALEVDKVGETDSEMQNPMYKSLVFLLAFLALVYNMKLEGTINYKRYWLESRPEYRSDIPREEEVKVVSLRSQLADYGTAGAGANRPPQYMANRMPDVMDQACKLTTKYRQ